MRMDMDKVIDYLRLSYWHTATYRWSNKFGKISFIKIYRNCAYQWNPFQFEFEYHLWGNNWDNLPNQGDEPELRERIKNKELISKGRETDTERIREIDEEGVSFC